MPFRRLGQKDFWKGRLIEVDAHRESIKKFLQIAWRKTCGDSSTAVFHAARGVKGRAMGNRYPEPGNKGRHVCRVMIDYIPWEETVYLPTRVKHPLTVIEIF